MLFEYTFFLKNFDSDFFDSKVAQKNAFIIPLNEQVSGRKRELFQTLLHSKNQFCFYLPSELTNYSNKFIKEEIIQNIVRLIFLPNYMRLGEKYIFFSEGVKDQNKKFNLVMIEFYNELKKQGIKDVITEILQFEQSFEGPSNENCISLVHYDLNNYLSNGIKEECFDTFIRKFVLPENFYKKWIVPIGSLDTFQHKIKLIEKFEKWITRTSPFNVRLIEMYKLVNNTNTKLELENKILKFKLDNSLYSSKLMREESYGFVQEVGSLRREVDRLAQQINNPIIDYPTPVPPIVEQINGATTSYTTFDSSPIDNGELMKQLQNQIDIERNRANAILEWYRKEYEILPRWYKKFGHVIKVFKGKRTFKSLFK